MRLPGKKAATWLLRTISYRVASTRGLQRRADTQEASHVRPTRPVGLSPVQAVNDPDFTHCRPCGEKHPEGEDMEVACASCGTKHPGGTCCPLCGSKECLQL